MNSKIIFSHPIFFVTTDINFSLGLVDVLPNYHIITSHYHPIIDQLQSAGKHVYCLEQTGVTPLPADNAGSLLNHPAVISYIRQNSPQPFIYVFKSSPQIEKACHKHNFQLLANPVHITFPLEDKIQFYQDFSQHQGIPLITSQIVDSDKLSQAVTTFPCVVQTSRGWAGKSTHIIHNQTQLIELSHTLQNTKAKLMPYISGFSYTINACIFRDQILTTAIASQINSPHPEFASNPAATCGRQWPAVGLSETEQQSLLSITRKIGSHLQQKNYHGHFGVDFILDQEARHPYVLEINPRLTASESWYSNLEILSQKTPLSIYHVASLINQTGDLPVDLTSPHGTQLIIRNSLSTSLTLSKQVTPGIYDELSTSAIPLNFQYHLTSQNSPQMLLRSAPMGKQISPGAEILRLETNYPLLDNTGKLPSQLIDQLVALKHWLITP